MKKIALMTHVVAGYRSIEESMALIRIMSDKQVDYIEVQIPFSDPIGDGSTITMANQYALSHGMTVSKSFDLIGAITVMTATPIIIMTYLNIVYAMGYECFFRTAQERGVRGVVIPDMPFISADAEIRHAFEYASKNNITIIPVISPNIRLDRMKAIADIFQQYKRDTDICSMVYCTQRTGVTGTHSRTDETHAHYLEHAKAMFSTSVAAGFGISSATQIQKLIGIVDIAVVGSHIMNLYKNEEIGNEQGIQKVARFLDEVNNIQ